MEGNGKRGHVKLICQDAGSLSSGGDRAMNSLRDGQWATMGGRPNNQRGLRLTQQVLDGQGAGGPYLPSGRPGVIYVDHARVPGKDQAATGRRRIMSQCDGG